MAPSQLISPGRWRWAAWALALAAASCTAPKPAPTPYDVTLAAAAMQAKDYDEAIRLWTNVLALNNLTPEQRARAYWGRSSCRLQEQQIDEALADADAGLAAKPDIAELLALRGDLYSEKRKLAFALTDFEAALKIKPNFPEAQALRGEVYMRQGRFDRAIADLDVAIASKPYVAAFYIDRGNIYFQEGKLDQAMADFDEAIRREPKSPDAFKMRGFAQAERSRWASAATDFEESLTLQPSQPYVVIWLHLTRLKTGQGDASELSQNAKSLDSKVWPAPIIAFYQGRLKAPDVLEEAARTDPNNDKGQNCEANFYVAESLIAPDNAADAKRMLLTAEQACPANFAEARLARAALNAL